MAAHDPATRRQIARAGGLTRSALYDGAEMTAAARAARARHYLDQIPADLPPKERERRATALRRADMVLLALRSAQARKARRGAS